MLKFDTYTKTFITSNLDICFEPMVAPAGRTGPYQLLLTSKHIQYSFYKVWILVEDVVEEGQIHVTMGSLDFWSSNAGPTTNACIDGLSRGQVCEASCKKMIEPYRNTALLEKERYYMCKWLVIMAIMYTVLTISS